MNRTGLGTVGGRAVSTGRPNQMMNLNTGLSGPSTSGQRSSFVGFGDVSGNLLYGNENFV